MFREIFFPPERGSHRLQAPSGSGIFQISHWSRCPERIASRDRRLVYVTAPVMSVCRKYLQKSGWYREISDLVPLWGGVFFCEQRARQPCLHGYLATATKIRCSAVCSGVSDCFSHLPSNKQEKESRRVKCRKKVY